MFITSLPAVSFNAILRFEIQAIGKKYKPYGDGGGRG